MRSFISASLVALLAFTLTPGANAQQTLLSSTETAGTITRYSITGVNQGAFSAFTQVGWEDVEVGPDGNVYVANFSNNTVRRFTATGTDLGVFISNGTLNGATGLAFDSAGNLYVANQTGGFVSRYSPTGTFLGNFVTGQSSPYGLAFDTSGNLYVANRDTNIVTRFNAAGTSLGTFIGTGLSRPTGLTFDTSGNLYVSNFNANTVSRFNSVGSLLNTILVGTNPVDMEFDATGNFFVAQFSANSIGKYSPTGTLVGGFPVPSNAGPTGLAIIGTAVAPEPGTGLLFALPALLLIAGSVRRRSFRPSPEREPLSDRLPSTRPSEGRDGNG